VTLHHEVRGDGPAVLLVHAGIADSRMWAPHVRTRVTRGGRDADPAVVELVATMQRAASAATLVPFLSG
jgi:hypothetical protein